MQSCRQDCVYPDPYALIDYGPARCSVCFKALRSSCYVDSHPLRHCRGHRYY